MKINLWKEKEIPFFSHHSVPDYLYWIPDSEILFWKIRYQRNHRTGWRNGCWTGSEQRYRIVSQWWKWRQQHYYGSQRTDLSHGSQLSWPGLCSDRCYFRDRWSHCLPASQINHYYLIRPDKFFGRTHLVNIWRVFLIKLKNTMRKGCAICTALSGKRKIIFWGSTPQRVVAAKCELWNILALC